METKSLTSTTRVAWLLRSTFGKVHRAIKELKLEPVELRNGESLWSDEQVEHIRAELHGGKG